MPNYVVVPDRTKLAFAVRGFVPTHGVFTQVTGTISTDDDNHFQSLDVTIDTRSLRTGLMPRDAHLKTGTFLDVRQFPTATYRGQHAVPVGHDRYAVYGVLRLHGREHPVTLDVALEPDDRADGMRRARVSGVVPRAPFAIPQNPLLRALMRSLIGDAVYITADVRVTLATASASTTARSGASDSHAAIASAGGEGRG